MMFRPVYLLFLFFLTGCSLILDEDTKNYLPGYSGASGEILVVIEDKFWNDTCGTAIQAVLEQNCFYLSSAEPIFNLIQVSKDQFGDLFKIHRNILLINIGVKPKNNERKVPVNIIRNRWAKGQVLVEINASSEKEFLKLFKERSEQIIDLINNEDLYRAQKKFKKQENKLITEKLEKQLGFSMVVPADAELAVLKKDFVWIKRDRKRILIGQAGATHDIDQNILIYFRNYTDSTMFSTASILNFRDSMGQKYVPGPIEGSYMSTEIEHFIPIRREFNWRDKYAVELRGLWKLHGFFMGGPFISLTTVDKANKRIITIEGNVFAPKFSKREYVRELEAMIYSFTETIKKPS